MLKYYLDITLQHSHEINQYFILQKVFQQLHLGFVEAQNVDGVVPIGLSFPNYHNKELDTKLCKLRLLATDENILEKFNVKHLLARFSDYVHMTGIRPVPSQVYGYAIYHRQQSKSASAYRRLVQRMSEREGITMLEAEAKITSFKQQELKVPYINVYSASSEQRFRLFIVRREAEASSYSGFNSYGLSNTSTVPEF